MTINASIVQDAFHYALAANGGTWRGLESAMSRTENSRGEYLKLAYQAARKANVHDVERPKRLSDVEDLLECLVGRCARQGLDPFTGEALCIGCKRVGLGDINERGDGAGLCWDCRTVKRSEELAAIATERARLQDALAALNTRVIAVTGEGKHTGCCFAAGPSGSNGGATSPCWCGHGDRPAPTPAPVKAALVQALSALSESKAVTIYNALAQWIEQEQDALGCRDEISEAEQEAGLMAASNGQQQG